MTVRPDAVRSIGIVGGGVAGCALAVALRGSGIDVTIIEAQDKWGPIGAGLTITGPALRAIRSLGLLEELIARGGPVYDYVLADAKTEVIETRPLLQLVGEELPALVEVHRPELHELLSRTARGSGAVVRTGATVQAIHADGDRVLVSLSDGTGLGFDLLVGADGAHSGIRRLLWPGVETAPTGGSIWRAFVAVDDVPERFATTFISALGPANRVVSAPTSGGRVYVAIVEPEAVSRRVSDDELVPMIRERLSDYTGWIGELRDRITDPSQVTYRPLETLLVPAPWYRDRVVLIGDAAHVMPPALAYGAGLAFEDAVVLAEELRTGEPAATALARFMDRRFERARFVVDMSNRLITLRQGSPEGLDATQIQIDAEAHLAQPI